jgi:hypothetical protein
MPYAVADDIEKLPFYTVAAVDKTVAYVMVFEKCEVDDLGARLSGERTLVFERDCGDHEKAVELMKTINDFLEDFSDKDRAKLYDLTVGDLVAMLCNRFNN